MKFPSLPPKRFAFLYLPSLMLFVALTFSLTAVWHVADAQQTKLSLSDILLALRSKKLTLAERNQIVTDAVKKRGITFSLSPEIEKELETAGADKDLIEAVRQASPVAKATPTPTPEPTPAPTPRAPDWQTFQNQANSLFVKGDFGGAIANYTKVIELNNKEASVFLSRGIAFFNQRNFDSAIADFGKAIELNPKEASAYSRRAEAFEKIGKFQSAIDDYQKTVDLDSGNDTAKNSLSRLQAEQAKIAAAQPKTVQPQPKSSNVNAEKTTEETKFVNVGSLKDVAIKLAIPTYPAFERQRKTEGVVTVMVTLDENGKVLDVEATDGPKALRQYAEDAARRSKFNPAKVNDQPVRARGYVAYNFKAS